MLLWLKDLQDLELVPRKATLSGSNLTIGYAFSIQHSAFSIQQSEHFYIFTMKMSSVLIWLAMGSVEGSSEVVQNDLSGWYLFLQN